MPTAFAVCAGPRRDGVVAISSGKTGPAENPSNAAAMRFAAGPIFPLLIATTPSRLGPAHTANAVGIQIASAALGLSAIPSLVGVLADAHGYEAIPVTLLALALALVVAHRWLASETVSARPR